MGGPRYTTRDLAHYGGLMGGIIIGFLGLQALGVHNYWIRLVCGLVVGVVLGILVPRWMGFEDD